jgi:hypothetical protein
VDQQSWDPSLKALTAFPAVLANMDKNLSWTEALGEAYFNQQQDVLDAVQLMRQRAQGAGNLQNTAQERVINDGSTIVIEPAYNHVVYVPEYDPWIVYGAPLAVYPGYSYSWFGGPFVSFGAANRLGFFGGFSWGWPAWGFNWRNRVALFNHNTFFSRSPFFSRRGSFIGGHGFVPRRSFPPARFDRGGFNNRPGFTPSPRIGNGWSNRGLFAPRMNTFQGSGTFNGARTGGFNRGMVFRAPSGGRTTFSSGRSTFGSGRSTFGGGRSTFGGGRSFGGSRGGGGGRHR